jgi:hypothetical protein
MIVPLEDAQCRSGARLKGDGYRWRYIAVWATGWLFLTGAVAGLVAGIIFATPYSNDAHGITDAATSSTLAQHPEWVAVALSVMAVCLLLFALMYRDVARLRFRAGSGFFGGLCGERYSVAPQTLDELKTACKEAGLAARRLSPVGSAWSNTLGQRTTTGHRIYMHRATARLPGGRTWLAGVTLKQVQNELAAETPSLQLIGVPSSSYVTLGAWVATLGHGNSGPAATHDLVVVSACVFDQTMGIALEMNAARLMDVFGKGPEIAANHIVLTVTLGEQSLYKNSDLRRQGKRVQTLAHANWALDDRAVMRAIFIGNTKTLALRWMPHKGKPLAESIVLKVWLFVFAAMGWGSAMPNYEGKDSSGKLSDEVYLFPDSFNPPQLWFQMILNIVNYELYTKDVKVDGAALLDISTVLQKLHAKHGGRTELRTLGEYVFFDMAMWTSATAFRDAFKALHTLGVKKCAQHPGKYLHTNETAACGGIQLVTAKEL